MKINTIGTDYNVASRSIALREKPIRELQINNLKSTNFSKIAFKGGNERHLFHQISEMSLFKQTKGGVATVGNDLFFFPLSHNDIVDFDRVIENIPLYNQEVLYVKELDDKGNVIGVKQDGVQVRKIPTGLPENHPFKQYEGQVFTTPLKIDKTTNLVEELAKPENYNKVFIVDLVGNKTIDWGLEKEVPTSMYMFRKDNRMIQYLKSQGWSDEQIKKIDITLTYIDSTASMATPYEDGSYSTATGEKAIRDMSTKWRGSAYAKEAKATAELMPLLKDKFNFDPKFVTCHDGQAMPLIQFFAMKNADGIEYYRDKILTAYGHNLNDGYMGSLSPKDAVITLAKKGEIEKIVNSNEYLQALYEGKEDEFLKSLLPAEMFDKRKQMNAVMFPIVYGEKGYLPMFTTVSYDYYKSIIENELISPALQERLKQLSEKGIFRGIINVLMDPLATGFTTKGLPQYHREDIKVKTADGKVIELPKFLAFDENKKYDIDHVRKIKQQNKISLLKRLDKSLIDAQLWSKDANGNETWLKKGSGFSAAGAGDPGAKFEILGGIDKSYLKKLEDGKDVPTFVFWGRGDWQKGADTGLKAWMKYVEKTGDKDSIYIFGGPLKDLKEVIELMKKIENGGDEKLAKFKGRVVCQLGWAPGKSYAAAADYATFASRFAPCELTDLEAMKKLCIPIVPKVQGMNQKVFDPTDTTEKAKYVNGYKGNYEYYMTEEKALKAASEEERTAFNKVKDKLVSTLSKDYEGKIGEPIPESLLEKQLKDHEDYRNALQRLRDSVIEDDMANSIERAIKDRNTDVASKILRNHVDLKTTWEENGWCNPGEKSTAQLLREMHYSKEYRSKNLKKGEELKLDLSGLTERIKSVVNGEKETAKPTRQPRIRSNSWFRSRTGKITAGVVGAGVLFVAGYEGCKHGWLSSKYADDKKHGHLSCVG